MAITTVAGAIAGLQIPISFSKPASGTTLAGSPASTWPIAGGYPAAGVLTAGLNGGTYSTSSSVPTGSLPRQDPLSGNAYLAKLLINSNQLGKLLVCDRIWDNTVPNTTTGAQSITTPTWPSRDAAGGTTGVGLHMGIEITAAASATVAVCTASYTDSSNNPSLTAALVDIPTAAAPGIGRFYRMSYDNTSADGGIKAIASINFSTAWTSGTFGLVVYRILAVVDLAIADVSAVLDAVTAGFPREYNGTTPFFLIETNITNSGVLLGVYQEAVG